MAFRINWRSHLARFTARIPSSRLGNRYDIVPFHERTVTVLFTEVSVDQSIDARSCHCNKHGALMASGLIICV